MYLSQRVSKTVRVHHVHVVLVVTTGGVLTTTPPLLGPTLVACKGHTHTD